LIVKRYYPGLKVSVCVTVCRVFIFKAPEGGRALAKRAAYPDPPTILRPQFQGVT